MNGILTFGALVAAMAAIVLFSEFFIDVYCSWMDRRDYRRRTNPRNIEKNAQDLLELELQQFLLEEEIKEKARNRMEHPSAYSKSVGGGLDGETREIIAKINSPREKRRRAEERQADGIRKIIPGNQQYKNYWGSE